MPFKKIRVFSFLTLIALSLSASNFAQQKIILSILLSEGMEFLSQETIFRDYEASHPEIELNIIYQPYSEQSFVVPPSDDIENHLDMMDNFTLQADVLMMSVGEFPWLSVEATRAGYILDLAPLFNADSNADPSVYYPTAWQAAQWDNGLWVLPTTTILSTVLYDAKAFDTAGLAYPNEDWRLSDFLNAADALATRNPEGHVTSPGFWGYNGSDIALFAQFLDQPLYDNSQMLDAPQFLRPDILDFANQWLPVLLSGAIVNFSHDYGDNFMLQTTPLMTGYLSMTYFNDLEFAPLPRDGAVVSIGGFVVSGRTEHPQLAYELASYLAADKRTADATQRYFSGTSLARPEYREVDRIIHNNMTRPSADVQTFIDESLQTGLPASELLYFPYIQTAFYYAGQGQMDMETALGNAEILARANLEAAAARRDELAGTIPTPVPELALAANEIELTVYFFEGDAGIWRPFVDEFVANDPEVARVVIQPSSSNISFREEGTDCFYYTSYLAQAENEYFLDISPLLAADANFVPEDWLTGVFDAVTKDNSIYALPTDIRPLALWYEPSQLEAFGLEVPQSSSELLDAFQTINSGGSTAFASYNLDTSLFMLLAANGAMPIQKQAGSTQIDFASENNRLAIQQLLDLIKNGTIKYDSFIDVSSDSFPGSEAFIMDDVANSLFRDEDYLPVVFPAGSQYTPVHYTVMAGYISRFSQHPEACYRFLSSLSHRPDLLNGLPALRSEAMRSIYTDFYDTFNQQLNAPNLLILPNYSYFETYWLFRAFDRYIFEDGDLLAELSAAEAFTKEYLRCLESGENEQACALQVDPGSVDA